LGGDTHFPTTEKSSLKNWGEKMELQENYRKKRYEVRWGVGVQGDKPKEKRRKAVKARSKKGG